MPYQSQLLELEENKPVTKNITGIYIAAVEIADGSVILLNSSTNW